MEGENGVDTGVLSFLAFSFGATSGVGQDSEHLFAIYPWLVLCDPGQHHAPP